MSNLKVNTINDASGGSAAVLYGVASPPNSMGFRNRIINGDMRIDQRNNGASVTPTAAVYSVDRWNAYCNQASKFSFQQNAGSVTPPSGFSKYLGVTSLSAYTLLTGDRFFLAQPIEGFNAADLAWGTASAQAVTVSFWVRSSLTGTFGGAVTEYLGTRSYPFTYTISAANTWEQKTVTIPGDTAGTWGSTNSGWGQVSFGLGCGATYSGTSGAWAAANYNSATGATSVVGTNGATFYITGVQLEAGTVATPFERRDYGRELMMCQRYCPVITAPSSSPFGNGFMYSSTAGSINIKFPVTTRVPATGVTVSSPSHFAFYWSGSDLIATAVNFGFSTTEYSTMDVTTASGATVNAGCMLRSKNNSAQLIFTGCEL